MLTIDHVTKTFGDYKAVDGLDLDIPEQQMFGLLGANGAGKTTTFRMILGLLSITEANQLEGPSCELSYQQQNRLFAGRAGPLSENEGKGSARLSCQIKRDGEARGCKRARDMA